MPLQHRIDPQPERMVANVCANMICAKTWYVNHVLLLCTCTRAGDAVEQHCPVHSSAYNPDPHRYGDSGREMNQQNCALAAQFVSSTYIQQGAEALATRHRLIKTLLSQRRLPEDGWDDDTILLFIKARHSSDRIGLSSTLQLLFHHRMMGTSTPFGYETLDAAC